MKTTTPTKLLSGQWGAAMNYIETHKPVLINSRDHHDIVMVLATDYEEMKQENERVTKMLLAAWEVVCESGYEDFNEQLKTYVENNH